MRLTCRPLKLKDHRFDPVGATGYESILVNHPWAEPGPQHHGHDDLLQIFPRPTTLETIGTLI